MEWCSNNLRSLAQIQFKKEVITKDSHLNDYITCSL